MGAYLLPWRKPECISGPGCLGKIPELLEKCGASHPMIVASRRQSATEAFQTMVSRLPDYCLFSDVPPNPRVSTVEAIAALYRAEGCDSFIAIGGGSPMDAAKAAAARLVRPNRTVEQMGGLLKVRRRIPPFVAVPTTAGTGSETTVAAVVTDDATHHKYALGDLCLIPRYAVLDPELTVSLPASITAQTGMDALTHAIEAYVGRWLPTAETNRLAEEAVVTIFRYLPEACRCGENLAAREQMLKASYQAGYAFTRASVGNIHAIAHTLGGLYDVPHGLANAVLLPVVLEDYGEAIAPQMARLAELTGVCTQGSQEEKARAFVEAIYDMNRRLGIPDGFDCIRSEDIPRMVNWAEAEANPAYPVPVIYDKRRFARIIQRVQRSV
ncbi:MAG: iron-containing alcohol dehydrogenase [Clostridiales bacterium]|nr:iron-containing alcohol dehydrogenase [Candidatus Cacconaster stercorequi]